MFTPMTPPTRRVPAQRRPDSGTVDLGGLQLCTLDFDSAGRPLAGSEAALAALVANGVTDLLMFCHGRQGRLTARSFFRQVSLLLRRHAQPGRRVLLVDVCWPGDRWHDDSVALPGRLGRPDSRGLRDLARWPELPGPAAPAAAPPDARICRLVRAAFDPEHRRTVDELLDLLILRPDNSLARFRARALIRRLAEAAPAEGDGERDGIVSVLEIDDPWPDQLFADFALRLTELGVITDPAGAVAGFGDQSTRLWHGAQEAVRQLTLWQLSARAGLIGVRGLGPVVARLHEQHPGLGINLIGHGLGARAVGYALTGLGDPSDRSAAPVRSVLLLQAAVSHFAFADRLPFDPARAGRLAGSQHRVDGPVIACYSRHDTAVGEFYPLSARAAGPDPGSLDPPEIEVAPWQSAGFDAAPYRWGALGHDGHQPTGREFALSPVGLGYDFTAASLVSIDVSGVVRRGRPPTGAHLDVCHPELLWLALTAAGLC